MENITDKLMQYQQIVQQLLLESAKIKPAYDEFEVETIFDKERHHYQIVHLGWHHNRWIYHCPIHLGIRNENTASIRSGASRLSYGNSRQL